MASTATATSTAALTATSTTKPGVDDTIIPTAPAAAKGKFWTKIIKFLDKKLWTNSVEFWTFFRWFPIGEKETKKYWFVYPRCL